MWFGKLTTNRVESQVQISASVKYQRGSLNGRPLEIRSKNVDVALYLNMKLPVLCFKLLVIFQCNHRDRFEVGGGLS